MQTGRPFSIFQDRNDISWGQHWEDQIKRSLAEVVFLIPVLTPSFFQSPACRNEFDTFWLKERTLGVNRLILPLYYVTCDQLGPEYAVDSDEIVDVLRSRNWTDWRQFRFRPHSDEEVAAALAGMAAMIKSSMKELDAIQLAANKSGAASRDEIALPDLSKSELEDIAPHEISYKIPELNPASGTDESIASSARAQPYYVYTTRFDEIVDASELADRTELLKLYSYVSSVTASLRDQLGTRLATNFLKLDPSSSRARFAVTILIDNSGSMRGRPILHCAAWCLLIMEWLDRLGIPTEILGFTTRAWKGGQSRELWMETKKPWAPGRLNDLRHLVYKSFSTTAEVSAPNFGVMVREGLLKENIDGEALLWASSRLERHPADYKALFVFSDGAPVDDSTLSVNPGNFLEQHLLRVIADVSKSITLYGVGIGHDVSRYYPNSAEGGDIDTLGIRFLEVLTKDPVFKQIWRAAD